MDVRNENHVPAVVVVKNDELASGTQAGTQVVSGRSLTNSQPMDVAIVDADGNQVGNGYAAASIVDGNATLTTTSDTAVIAAQGSGVRLYITSFSISNTSASPVRVDIKDGTTTKVSFYVAASGGGAAYTMPTPLRLTANTALNAALSGAVTDVRVSAQGYKSTS